MMPPAFLLLSAVLMVALHLLVPVRQIVQAPWRALGALPLAAGIGVVLWVARMFRRRDTTIRPFEESSSLVVEGPFRISRNPVYLSLVLALLGVGLLLGSLTPFLVVPAFALLIDRRFIRVEEAMLERRFGSQYLALKSRVRRWL
jgi:protein-S-isoprenylcysteine O-methyltransferase Ste14